MSLERRIFYNTLVQSLGKVFAAFLGLLTVALLSRYLEEGGFGQYSTVVAFLGFFAVMADLGLYLIVVREISKPDTDRPKILSNALGMRLVAAGISLALGALIALLFPYEPIVKKAMFIGIAAFVFVSLNQVLIGVFQKHLVQHLIVISETVGRAVNFLLVYWFITKSLPLPFFVFALVAANATTFFLTFKFARRLENFTVAFDFAVWKKILSSSWPLVFAVVLNLLYFKTDTVILSLFHSKEAVGVYSLPYKLLEGFLAFPAMFVGLVMPLLSKSAFQAWREFKEILQKSFDALILLAIPTIIGGLFFAADIINLLKGQQDYRDSPQILQILIFSVATIFLGTLFGYAVVAVNEQKAMIKGYLAGATVGLVLYFCLIPKYSYWGAAWGTLVTEIIVASFAYFLVRKASGQGVSLKILWPALPGALSLILFFKFVSMEWIAEIVLGLLVYLVLLIVFKAIPWQLVKALAFRE